MIDRALADNNPFIALGSYVHYYGVALFDMYCRSVGMTRPEVETIVVAEIGPEHGHLAAMMLAKYPEVNYVFIDHAERLTAIAAELCPAFPNATHLFAENQDDVTRANLDEWRMVFVPMPLADALVGKHVDLVWTFHGMNGLENSSIAHFFDLVQSKMRPRTFMYRNRFLNVANEDGFAECAATSKASVLADAQWTIREWSPEPSILGCPYVDGARHPRYLEAVLQRLVKPDTDDVRINAKRACLSRTTVQAWVEVLRAPVRYAMTWGARPLRLPLGRDGTLFELWNLARLAPGRDVFLILLHYLDYCALPSGRIFEEWLFYAAVLKELHIAAPDSASGTILKWIEGRVAEGAKFSFRPMPSWELGFEPLPELLPIDAVRKVMASVDVPASLRLV
jgi:hypothetical protein